MAAAWEEQRVQFDAEGRSLRLLVERGTAIHALRQTETPYGFYGLLVLFPHGATERVAATAERPAGGDAPSVVADLSDGALRSADGDVAEQPPIFWQIAAGNAGRGTPPPLVRVQANPELLRRLIRGFAPAATLLDLRRAVGGTYAPDLAVLSAELGTCRDGRLAYMEDTYADEVERMAYITRATSALATWYMVRWGHAADVRVAMLREKAFHLAHKMLSRLRVWPLPPALSWRVAAGAAAVRDDATCREAAARLAAFAGPAHADAVQRLASAHLRGLGRRRAAAAAIADAWCRYAGAPWGPTARYVHDVQRGWRPASEVATDGTDSTDGTRDVARVVLGDGARRAYDAERTAALRLALRQLDRPADRAAARRMPLMELGCLCARLQRQQ